MKRRIVAIVLSMAMAITMLPATSLRAEQSVSTKAMERIVSPIDGQPKDNLGRSATATAGYTNTFGISPEKINDGTLATADSSTSWNSWGAAENQYPMDVTLTWTETQNLASMRVMWWADGGGVTFPSSAKVQYLDGEEWKDISDVGIEHGGYNGADGVWNIVNFDKTISTKSLRMLVGKGGGHVGISEWEVYDDALPEYISSASIAGKGKLAVGATGKFTGNVTPSKLSEGTTYEWSVTEGADKIEIQGAANTREVSIKALAEGNAKLHLKAARDGVSQETDLALRILNEEITSIDPYNTSTAVGVAPILPDSVVANGVEFDEPTPSYISKNNNYDYGETFNSKLLPVKWDAVNASDYAADKAGKSFTVNGTVTYDGKTYTATANISVKAPVTAAESNSSVTFENVQLEDEFWMPKQETNAMTSLNKAILEIAKDSGGEPNFDNAIKKLNNEEYNAFQGYVFQDSDIYKSIEAISYTLSATKNDTSAEVKAQREILEDKLESWIQKIEKVQYADGYIDTFFTLRSEIAGGGGHPGTHRWVNLANHEMYNAGHFLEGVVAYTRYREGINNPDYRLYVAGKRFADHIVTMFGPNGKRHEVPGHEEIELALVKFGKLAEEYEGEGAGKSYYDTAKLLIDRRGEDSSLRDSGYNGDTYSQDRTPFKNETNAVGHAVRANYFYAGVTDIATLLPESDPDKAAYINSLGAIWDSVTERKTYITGGIGATTKDSDAEGFGADYDLPPNQSYCEICAAIAAANWNQRMNLLHEDGKYADMVEKNLYNSILVGENLDGNRFFYSTLLEVNGGNSRSEWFGCACCPPNLMRTIASLSGYMYTVHKNDVFVNMFVGSNGSVNVGGTQVGLKQETKYPWDGAVALTVSLKEAKKFALKVRIPGWVNEQKNKNVTIKVNGNAVTFQTEKGYAAIDRTWANGDVVSIDSPMEIRITESHEKVTATQGKIALQRGPIVYCMEKAGNAQLNTTIENFDPLNFVIPRDAKLTATYKENLLKGVVEITGDVKYATGRGNEMIDAKLQAVPYYAWNNRGDDAEYTAGLEEPKNNSSRMLIWTMADSPDSGKKPGLCDYATPSVNYVGWGMGAENFADSDESTFWNGHNDPDLQTKDQWMMYDFGERKAELTESSILFHDDGGGVVTPTGVKFEYMTDAGTWAEVKPVGDWTYNKEEYNTYKFEKIVTSKIRVTMNHAVVGGQKVAVAVVEWKLEGKLAATTDDKKELSDLVKDYEDKGLKESDYTAESWKVYKEALENAKKVLQKADADLVTEVLTARDALVDAMNNLVKKTPEPPVQSVDKTNLKATINTAKKKYKKADYTAASWKTYDKALKAAQKVLDNKNATQAQVNKANTDLKNAIKKLVKLKVISTKNVTLGVGEKYSVKTKNCTYVTSTSKVAAVSKKGLVTPKKTGKATIKAINKNGKVKVFKLTIKKAPKKITKVTPTKKTLKKGKTCKLKVTLPKGTASKLTFTSSNKKIATVSSKGVVKAKKKGKAVITVKTFNKKTKKVKITVK